MAINLGISMASPPIFCSPSSSSFSRRRTAVKTYCSLPWMPNLSTNVDGDSLRSGPKKKIRPPDMASDYLYRRIVFIDTEFMPEISEILVQKLLYLQCTAPEEPIYLYISCEGVDQEWGLDSDGLAVYDTLMLSKCKVITVALGPAEGHACLLLAAGTKGKRYMLQDSTATISCPDLQPTMTLHTSDVLLRREEAVRDREILVDLFAKHTGNSKELVRDLMKAEHCMDSIEAKEFGIIDEIVYYSRKEVMEGTTPGFLK